MEDAEECGGGGGGREGEREYVMHSALPLPLPCQPASQRDINDDHVLSH